MSKLDNSEIIDQSFVIGALAAVIDMVEKNFGRADSFKKAEEMMYLLNKVGYTVIENPVKNNKVK